MKRILILLSLVSSLLLSNTLLETQRSVKDRIKFDIKKIKMLIEDSNLTNKNNLMNQLDSLLIETDDLVYPLEESGFKATLPFDIALHKNIFSIYSQVLDLYTTNDLTIWHTPKNEKLDLYEIPSNNLAPLNIKMMNNEYRYETFNISNSSSISQELNLSLLNIPNNTNLKIFKGEFVDGRRIDSAFSSTWYKRLPGGVENTGGTDALIELNSPYQVTIPSGTSKQITILVKTNNTQAGNYPIDIQLNSSDISHETVRLNLTVSDLKLSTLDYSLSMYDYISDKKYIVSNTNREALKETHNSHYGDTPKVVLSLPERDDFDENGTFLEEYDFSELDRVLSLFPNAKYYLASLTISSSYTFAGINFYSSEWTRAMGTWTKALAKHMSEQGKNPSQLIISVAHEPRTLDKMNKGLKFARAVKKYAPEITTLATLYATAAFSTELGKELIKNLDILTIARHHFYGNTSTPNKLTPEAKTFYRNIQKNSNWNQELWFYGTIFAVSHSAEDRILHITRDFYNHANGSSYWSLVDNGKNPSGWNMYPRYRPGKVKTRYSPLFITEHTVTTSRQWEAVREAQQNNKYAIMLRNIVKKLESEGHVFNIFQKNQIDTALNIVPLTAAEAEIRRLDILSLLEMLDTDGYDTVYLLKVKNGKSSQIWNYQGDTVEIIAEAPTSNHIFEKWNTFGGGIITNVTSSTTSFTMPNNMAMVTASFKYIGDEDFDTDGLTNAIDYDDDDDGIVDDLDAFPFNPLESKDTDGDGIGNNTDLDDDGDGFSDEHELANGTDPLDKNDYHGTSRVLRVDSFPNFGEVQIGEEKKQVLTIHNDGNAPLTISEIIYLHPSNKNVFTFESWSGEIASGDSKSIEITYKPTSTKSIEAALYIRSNKTSGVFKQVLNGGKLEIETSQCTKIFKFITKNGISFNPGETKTITIANTGLCDLTINRTRFHNKIDESYSLTGISMPKVIAPNTQVDISITYQPSATASTHKGLVYFESDKTNHTDRSRLLKGN